jgi:hypothetical protein
MESFCSLSCGLHLACYVRCAEVIVMRVISSMTSEVGDGSLILPRLLLNDLCATARRAERRGWMLHTREVSGSNLSTLTCPFSGV